MYEDQYGEFVCGYWGLEYWEEWTSPLMGYINPAIEQKPAACCVVFMSNSPLPKDYVLLRRFPKKTWGQSPLHCCVPEEGAWQCIPDFYCNFYMTLQIKRILEKWN